MLETIHTPTKRRPRRKFYPHQVIRSDGRPAEIVNNVYGWDVYIGGEYITRCPSWIEALELVQEAVIAS